MSRTCFEILNSIFDLRHFTLCKYCNIVTLYFQLVIVRLPHCVHTDNNEDLNDEVKHSQSVELFSNGSFPTYCSVTGGIRLVEVVAGRKSIILVVFATEDIFNFLSFLYLNNYYFSTTYLLVFIKVIITTTNPASLKIMFLVKSTIS